MCAKWRVVWSGACPVAKENGLALQWAKMTMVGWMCGIKRQDGIPSGRFRDRLRLDDIMCCSKI